MVFFVALGLPAKALAVGQDVLRDLYSSAEACAMGNAITAIVGDERSLYYNPAGLAGVGAPKLTYLDLQAEVSGDVISTAQSNLNLFKDLSYSTLNNLIGKTISGQLTYAPTLVLPGFGMGLLVDQQVAVYSENLSLPSVTLGYQTTNGVKVGYGHSFFLGARGSQQAVNEIRVGLGGELLFRRGGYYNLSESQILNISEAEFKDLIGNFGEGFGVDAGMQYIRRATKRLTLMAGMAWEGIGNVHFNNSTATTQNGDLSLGVGLRYEASGLTTTVSYDLKDLDQSTDWRYRQHGGVQFKLPLVSVSAGINEVSYTYGASVDVWLAKVSFTSYAEQVAALADLATERRYLLRVALSF